MLVVARAFAFQFLCTLGTCCFALDVSAKSAVIMDERTGKLLWSREPDTPRYPASTTKILTALLLLERARPEAWVTAPKDIEKVREASMHLRPGERIRVRDLVKAILLRSANDGSHAAAVHLAKSDQNFASIMNQRSLEIGAANSNFTNPHGLHNPNHYSTARNLALIAREAMRNPEFRDIVRVRKVKIERSINQEDLWMVSKNKWLTLDATADGIKTGYTKPAGKCFIGSATRSGYRLITVVLNSEDWMKDHGQLLQWGFKAYQHWSLPSGKTLAAFELEGAATPVAVHLDKAYETITTPEKQGQYRIEIDEYLTTLPIQKGSLVAKARIVDADGFETPVSLYASDGVAMKTNGSSLLHPVGALVGDLLIAATVFVRRRVRNW